MVDLPQPPINVTEMSERQEICNFIRQQKSLLILFLSICLIVVSSERSLNIFDQPDNARLDYPNAVRLN
ncbi:MAG: hypothetical protein WBW99_11835 [Pseudolabrys sp.]